MQTKKRSLVVIGGGLGGLVLTYRMLLKGWQVTILEKNYQVGGLAAGFELNNTCLEMAYHHIFKSDRAIINLMEELGLADKIHWYESTVAIINSLGMQKFVGPWDLLKFKGLDLLDKFRLGLTVFFLQKKNSYKDLENVPAYQWMRKFCGKNAYETIWEPLLVGKFGDDYREVSMAWLWARIHTRGSSSQGGKEYLGYFEGGFEILVCELKKRILKMGGKIKLNIKLDNKSFSTLRKKYFKVVFTGSNQALADLISQEKETTPLYLYQLLKTKYLGAICIVFTSKQKLSPYYWHNINFDKAPFLAMIEHTNLVPKSWYGDEEVYYLGKYTNNIDADVEKEWFAFLKKCLPEFNQKTVLQKFIFRLKNAQQVVTCGYQLLPYKTPLKNVYLMNFSQIYPEDRGTNFAVAEANKLSKII